MKTDINSTWIPTFEFQDWIHQSFLVLPTPAESSAAPKTAVTCQKWAKGDLRLVDSPDGSGSSGTLTFAPTVELMVSVKCTAASGNAPAPFQATGTGIGGPLKGVIYQLAGWAFRGPDGKVESVQGGIQAVRGSDAKPEVGLGGFPVGTVGYFVIKGK